MTLKNIVLLLTNILKAFTQSLIIQQASLDQISCVKASLEKIKEDVDQIVKLLTPGTPAKVKIIFDKPTKA
jgi:hypothetical protein